MFTGSELVAALFGVTSAVMWGIGDFSGGLATRRISALTVTLLVEGVGLVVLLLVALAWGEPLPVWPDFWWSGAGGVLGLFGLMALYRAMALGQMGLAAPVTAVLAAGLPVIVSIATQGFPHFFHLVGLVTALLGIWLISRPQGQVGRPAGLGLAVAAGIGFGGYLVCLAQVETGAILWPVAIARAVSIILILGLALAGRRLIKPSTAMLPLILLAGVMDTGGNTFFVLAEQAGRLDVAGTLSSLYPAVTVLLALLILKEKLTRVQGLGVLLALLAIPLIVS
jgi:drug/metabolite transporter (DMT)-like permease